MHLNTRTLKEIVSPAGLGPGGDVYMVESHNTQGTSKQASKGAGVIFFHVIVMLGLLIAAGFTTFVQRVYPSSGRNPLVPVLFWLGFALYFGITEVLPQRVNKRL